MISSAMTHQQGLCSMDPPPKRKRSTQSSTQPVSPSEKQATPEGTTASVFKSTHPPIQQSMYNYDCYNVNIALPVYNSFTHAAQAPPKDTCYCGLKLSGPTELAQHKAVNHKGGYSCSKCGKVFQNNRGTWKHFRAQHLYIYTHMCQVKGCKFWKKKGTYGNDDQTLVWKHMNKKHGVTSPPRLSQMQDDFFLN